MLDMATAQQSNWMQKTNLRRVHVSDNDDSSFCLFNHQHNDGQLKDSPLRHSSFILISKAEVLGSPSRTNHPQRALEPLQVR